MSEEPFIHALIKHRIGALLIDSDNPDELRFYATNGTRKVELAVMARGGQNPEFVEYWAEQVAKQFRKAGRDSLEV
jgi:hypothetical protein